MTADRLAVTRAGVLWLITVATTLELLTPLPREAGLVVAIGAAVAACTLRWWLRPLGHESATASCPVPDPDIPYLQRSGSGWRNVGLRVAAWCAMSIVAVGLVLALCAPYLLVVTAIWLIDGSASSGRLGLVVAIVVVCRMLVFAAERILLRGARVRGFTG
ncbi:hypothetical protein [Aeromicrobium sp. Leaf350]|uniref:hypothetical protein n=1 Tax=Aeromicrobium sp. Leaf350 TaxID=2876565 RepID=UPI001E3BFC46|nr:hypothetical protein [Aeromicrobium sp. Leaf350]